MRPTKVHTPKPRKRPKHRVDYEREWKKKLKQELRIGYWARKFYEYLNDGQIDKIFAIMKSRGIDQTLVKAEELSFDWHGEIVLRLLENRAMSKAFEMMKFPFHLSGGSKGSRGIMT